MSPAAVQVKTQKKATKMAAMAPVATPDSTLDKLESDFLTRVGKCANEGEAPEGVIGTFKRWSSSAVECYMRDANCDGCYYSTFFSDKPYDCKMYLAVAQLLETHGQPTRSMLAKHS